MAHERYCRCRLCCRFVGLFGRGLLPFFHCTNNLTICLLICFSVVRATTIALVPDNRLSCMPIGSDGCFQTWEAASAVARLERGGGSDAGAETFMGSWTWMAAAAAESCGEAGGCSPTAAGNSINRSAMSLTGGVASSKGGATALVGRMACGYSCSCFLCVGIRLWRGAAAGRVRSRSVGWTMVHSCVGPCTRQNPYLEPLPSRV